ncbi:MAG: NTP transferase domain-containing protein [Gammaproteobacteria bacterium]|nr:NTP transferase domain-containing protein [Gammaproteobacteria bacterium]
MTDFKVIILAIFDENDFQNKVSTKIHDKPMIQYVFESAQGAGATDIVVATDSQRVGMIAEDFGATVCMIVDDELKGINRLSEVVARMGWDDDAIVVNVPADAPLTPSAIIQQVVDNLVAKEDVDFATLYSHISREAAEKEYTINMVVDNEGYVMYFSRCPIPFQSSDLDFTPEYKNYIELSAYRVSLLKKYTELPKNALDSAENIEELKLLASGMKIHAAEASSLIGQRIFTEKDIGKVTLQIAPNR